MKQISSKKARDNLPADPEAAIAAFEKRTSRPPPPPKTRRKAFDLMIEDFIRGVREKGDLFHQK